MFPVSGFLCGLRSWDVGKEQVPRVRVPADGRVVSWEGRNPRDWRALTSSAPSFPHQHVFLAHLRGPGAAEAAEDVAVDSTDRSCLAWAGEVGGTHRK